MVVHESTGVGIGMNRTRQPKDAVSGHIVRVLDSNIYVFADNHLGVVAAAESDFIVIAIAISVSPSTIDLGLRVSAVDERRMLADTGVSGGLILRLDIRQDNGTSLTICALPAGQTTWPNPSPPVCGECDDQSSYAGDGCGD